MSLKPRANFVRLMLLSSKISIMHTDIIEVFLPVELRLSLLEILLKIDGNTAHGK